MKGLRELNVGACLDTAHLFAAGYDIRSAEGLNRTLEDIDRIVGLANVPVFHVNDSKIPLAGRVDRHDHIGHGKIGAEAFERLLRHPLLTAPLPSGQGRAFLLETPIDDPGDDRRNVAKLWDLADLKDVAPASEKGFSMLTPAMKRMKTAIEKKGKKFASSRDLPVPKKLAARKTAKKKSSK